MTRWQCVGANGEVRDGGRIELEEEVMDKWTTRNVLEDLWAVL